MRSGVPWQVQVRPEARETAREAARRSGMSVSEWLDSLIIDPASREGIEPASGRTWPSRYRRRPGLGPRAAASAPICRRRRRHRPVARDDRPEPAAYQDTAGRLAARAPRARSGHRRGQSAPRQPDAAARPTGAAQCRQREGLRQPPGRSAASPRRCHIKLDRRLDQLVAEGRSATSEIERRMSAVDRVVADLGQQSPVRPWPPTRRPCSIRR